MGMFPLKESRTGCLVKLGGKSTSLTKQWKIFQWTRQLKKRMRFQKSLKFLETFGILKTVRDFWDSLRFRNIFRIFLRFPRFSEIFQDFWVFSLDYFESVRDFFPMISSWFQGTFQRMFVFAVFLKTINQTLVVKIIAKDWQLTTFMTLTVEGDAGKVSTLHTALWWLGPALLKAWKMKQQYHISTNDNWE